MHPNKYLNRESQKDLPESSTSKQIGKRKSKYLLKNPTEKSVACDKIAWIAGGMQIMRLKIFPNQERSFRGEGLKIKIRKEGERAINSIIGDLVMRTKH